MKNNNLIFCAFIILVAGISQQCTRSNDGAKEEQIRIDTTGQASADTSGINSIKGNVSLQQLNTFPQNVVLTGLPEHRLITIYKKVVVKRSDRVDSYSYYESDFEDGANEHFMPGIDLLQGYNLLNLAHYNMNSGATNLLFDHPVLVKSLYYPSFVQDSLDGRPVNRDYFLVSAYDSDTNLDTLINRHDLRRMYHFNATCTERKLLLPKEYSVTRSQYDPRNDAMFIFAKFDANNNGLIDKQEPLHVFWISLKTPGQAKRMY